MEISFIAMNGAIYILITLNLIRLYAANPPNIDYSNNMRILKLPKNLKPGTIVYRLKGTDADNDNIEFGVRGATANSLLDIRKVSFHEADVYLKSPLEAYEYNITIYATDSKEFTEVESTIIATEVEENATLSPFIISENIFKIFENATNNSTVGSIIAKEKTSSNLPVTFELRGSDKFFIRYVFGPRGTSKAEIVLANGVDYEKQSLYVLTIVALNAWTNETVDSRNIALMELLVVIEDIQDSPPVFLNLPTVVRIAENTKIGSVVFRISAEDGDHGNKRNITYSIDNNSGGKPQSYFSVDDITGDIILTHPIPNIKSDVGTTQPILLTVKATELTENKENIAWITSSSDVALVIISTVNKRPHFRNEHLIGSIDENSHLMTPVKWEGMSVPQVFDDDPGLNGTIVLEIDDPSHTFMIQPIKGINDLSFSVIVKNNEKLDFETNLDKQFNLIISATDQSIQEPQTTKILCTIKLIDLNDNIPQFTKKVYEASILEDAEPGVTVARIEANDVDSGDFGQIRYTSINGPIANNLHIDSETGIIVLKSNDDIDREIIPEYRLTIEARDQLGRGNKNVTELHIKLIDANDNIPTFLQSRYDAILKPDRSNFTQPLIVKALDADEPNTVNSNVTYEIINGNYQDKFAIDIISGEILLKSPLTIERKFQTADQAFNDNNGEKFLPEFVLTIRAHDKGIPYRWSTVLVHIYNPDFLNRTVVFIFDETVNRVKENLESIEDGLGMITGANVYIPHDSIRSQRNKTIVNAWIAYPTQSIIDLSKLPVIYTKLRGKDYEIFEKNTKNANTKETENIKTGQLVTTDFQTLFWLLIILVLITLIFLIVFIIFWCCCCRNDHQRRQKLNQKSDKLTTRRDYISTENGSVVKEVDSTRDNELNKSANKRKRDVGLQAWNEESDTQAIYRPSSAPHYEHNQNKFKTNSLHAYHDSGSMYQRFKKRRNQRIRVSPEYYYEDNGTPYHDQNEAILLNKLYQNPGYATVRHPDYFMQTRFDRNRLYKDEAIVGYMPNMTSNQFDAQSYLTTNIPEYSSSLRSNRPKASHMRYSDNFRSTTPKTSEILYVQTPNTNKHIESNGQNEFHNNQSLDSLDYPKPVNEYALNANNVNDDTVLAKRKQSRHVSFHTGNTDEEEFLNDNIREESQPINQTVFEKSNEKLKSVLTPIETTTDLYAYNSQKEYITSSSDDARENGKHNRTINQFPKKSLAQNNSKNQSEKLTQPSIVMKISDSNSDTQSVINNTLNKAESSANIELKKSKKLTKNVSSSNKKITRLKKENSSDNSDKSYDSDSGIGHSAINNNPNLEIKNSALMEKKSVFTIAYNDVKTRHLQSAESTND